MGCYSVPAASQSGKKGVGSDVRVAARPAAASPLSAGYDDPSIARSRRDGAARRSDLELVAATVDDAKRRFSLKRSTDGGRRRRLSRRKRQAVCNPVSTTSIPVHPAPEPAARFNVQCRDVDRASRESLPRKRRPPDKSRAVDEDERTKIKRKKRQAEIEEEDADDKLLRERGECFTRPAGDSSLVALGDSAVAADDTSNAVDAASVATAAASLAVVVAARVASRVAALVEMARNDDPTTSCIATDILESLFGKELPPDMPTWSTEDYFAFDSVGYGIEADPPSWSAAPSRSTPRRDGRRLRRRSSACGKAGARKRLRGVDRGREGSDREDFDFLSLAKTGRLLETRQSPRDGEANARRDGDEESDEEWDDDDDDATMECTDDSCSDGRRDDWLEQFVPEEAYPATPHHPLDLLAETALKDADMGEGWTDTVEWQRSTTTEPAIEFEEALSPPSTIFDEDAAWHDIMNGSQKDDEMETEAGEGGEDEQDRGQDETKNDEHDDVQITAIRPASPSTLHRIPGQSRRLQQARRRLRTTTVAPSSSLESSPSSVSPVLSDLPVVDALDLSKTPVPATADADGVQRDRRVETSESDKKKKKTISDAVKLKLLKHLHRKKESEQPRDGERDETKTKRKGPGQQQRQQQQQQKRQTKQKQKPPPRAVEQTTIAIPPLAQVEERQRELMNQWHQLETLRQQQASLLNGNGSIARP